MTDDQKDDKTIELCDNCKENYEQLQMNGFGIGLCKECRKKMTDSQKEEIKKRLEIAKIVKRLDPISEEVVVRLLQEIDEKKALVKATETV